MKKILVGLAVVFSFAFVPVALRAQQNPVVSSVRQTVSGQGRNLVAGAQEMPASKFNYTPTPAQMTFGHLVLHIAQSNNFLCSQISGDKAPSTGKLTEHSPKSQLIAAMKSSFGFCDQSLAKLDGGDLSGQVQFFGGRKITKAAALVALTNDLADHYAQEAIYLRLNGHLPPTAMRSAMGGGSRGRGGM